MNLVKNEKEDDYHMTRKTESNYAGIYQIKQSPIKMQANSAETWAKIEHFMATHGHANFDELTMVAKDHQSGSEGSPHPYQFITYCIGNGWLELVEESNSEA